VTLDLAGPEDWKIPAAVREPRRPFSVRCPRTMSNVTIAYWTGCVVTGVSTPTGVTALGEDLPAQDGQGHTSRRNSHE